MKEVKVDSLSIYILVKLFSEGSFLLGTYDIPLGIDFDIDIVCKKDLKRGSLRVNAGDLCKLIRKTRVINKYNICNYEEEIYIYFKLPDGKIYYLLEESDFFSFNDYFTVKKDYTFNRS